MPEGKQKKSLLPISPLTYLSQEAVAAMKLSFDSHRYSVTRDLTELTRARNFPPPEWHWDADRNAGDAHQDEELAGELRCQM